jgi:uncharacterized membrane protein
MRRDIRERRRHWLSVFTLTVSVRTVVSLKVGVFHFGIVSKVLSYLVRVNEMIKNLLIVAALLLGFFLGNVAHDSFFHPIELSIEKARQ